jgi:hypothetical protein
VRAGNEQSSLAQKIILLRGQDGLRRSARIRTLPNIQRDEFSFCTSKFESDMPSHGVGLSGGISRCATDRLGPSRTGMQSVSAMCRGAIGVIVLSSNRSRYSPSDHSATSICTCAGAAAKIASIRRRWLGRSAISPSAMQSSPSTPDSTRSGRPIGYAKADRSVHGACTVRAFGIESRKCRYWIEAGRTLTGGDHERAAAGLAFTGGIDPIRGNSRAGVSPNRIKSHSFFEQRESEVTFYCDGDIRMAYTTAGAVAD